MTASVSENNSRVIGFPLHRFRIASRRGPLGYTQRCFVALCTDPDVAAGRVFDRRQRLGADRASRHLLGVDAGEPFAPVGPPRALVLLRALEPVGKCNVLDIVVGPELVLARGWRVDHACNMPASRQYSLHRAAAKWCA